MVEQKKRAFKSLKQMFQRKKRAFARAKQMFEGKKRAFACAKQMFYGKKRTFARAKRTYRASKRASWHPLRASDGLKPDLQNYEIKVIPSPHFLRVLEAPLRLTFPMVRLAHEGCPVAFQPIFLSTLVAPAGAEHLCAGQHFHICYWQPLFLPLRKS
jgi:hypothetical protein